MSTPNLFCGHDQTNYPQTPLTLVSTPATAPPIRRCDVCLGVISGTYYTCKVDCRCGFDVHPMCSQPSRMVDHVLDSRHYLQLLNQAQGPCNCNVCGNSCVGWAYRCRECNIDIHFGCLFKTDHNAGSGSSNQESRSGSTRSSTTRFICSLAKSVLTEIVVGVLTG